MPCISGGLSVFIGFLVGFSVKSNGVGAIEWGFSKMDGVPVELVKSQWGCLESQWGLTFDGDVTGGSANRDENFHCHPWAR